MTINTYFVKKLLKTILKMSYNTYTGGEYSLLKKLVNKMFHFSCAREGFEKLSNVQIAIFFASSEVHV